MRFSFLTPHQFESTQPGVDTLLVTAFTIGALDVAVPHAAAEMISAVLSERIASMFGGRLSTMQSGAVVHPWFLNPDTRQDVLSVWAHPVHFAIVLTDRMMVSATTTWAEADGTQWLVFDWWQWLRLHVPARRLGDAQAFLCHACRSYRESAELRQIGIDQDLAHSMQEEGEKILDVLANALSERIIALWAGS